MKPAALLVLIAVAAIAALSPARSASASGIVAITASGSHVCLLNTGGGVQCFGRASAGANGDGTTEDRATPVDVVGLQSGISQVIAGGEHTCAITDAGGAKCWGWNFPGEVGDGTNTMRLTPVNVVGLSSGVVSMTTGRHTSCAVLATTGVKCWGFNSNGQVGDGTITNRNVPTNVAGLANGVASIGGRRFHICAVMQDGSLKCWGSNFIGELGDGTFIDRWTPVDVQGLGTQVTAVAGGDHHTCAITVAGGLKCWGANSAGQLGDGEVCGAACVSPVDALVGGTVTQVAAGGQFSCVLLEGGDVQCWGEGFGGNAPAFVAGLDGPVKMIAAARLFACALTEAGSVQCWGDLYTDTPATIVEAGTKPTPTPTLAQSTPPPIGGVSFPPPADDMQGSPIPTLLAGSLAAVALAGFELFRRRRARRPR